MIDNVYIVYLSCDIVALMYNCCVKGNKNRKLQGSVVHVPTLVYALDWETPKWLWCEPPHLLYVLPVSTTNNKT